MAYNNYKSIWKDIVDNAGTDLADIIAALQTTACFFQFLSMRDWTRARS